MCWRIWMGGWQGGMVRELSEADLGLLGGRGLRTGKSKMRRFFPFDKLRVRMTVFVVVTAADRELRVASAFSRCRS
jgi:hypothetical protein